MPLDKIREAFFQQDIRQVGVCSYQALASFGLLPSRGIQRLPADPQSVIVCLLPYYGGDFPQRNVARYAVWDDYHRTGGGLLEKICDSLSQSVPGQAFVPFLDASPLPEVEAARLAGLGRVGRHGMLISPEYGGDAFIGTIVTDGYLEPSSPLEGSCLECDACITACPSGALSRDGLTIDRCRSYITQKKGTLEPWQAGEIQQGGMAWGCDCCLDACPMNPRKPSPLQALLQNPVPVMTKEQLSQLLPIKAYGYRGKAVLLRNLELIG